MTLHEKIKAEITDAMRARDSVRLTTLRSLVTAFTNELIATGHKPQEVITDVDALKVIKRSVNQHKDSIEQFRNGGREDLVANEEAELKILEVYLPQMMSRGEIKKIVEAKKAELAVTDKSKMGAFMGAVMKELAGRADGGEVKAVIDELFV
jgi:uncharacterized protein YqeY